MFPDDADTEAVRDALWDPFEYFVARHRDGLLRTDFKQPLGAVSYQIPCHLRVQKIGRKTADLLRLIPGTEVSVVERCSGHGGTFGVMKATHPLAVKVGKPAARQIAQKDNDTLCSDCPLACKHLGQMVSAELADGTAAPRQAHPIEIFAQAYGLA